MRPDFTPSPQLYPFESRWMATSAGQVHYVDEGQGPPILFLHGNPTWSFLYRRVIARLRDRFRCVAADYPGVGLSDRPSGYGYTPAEHANVVAELEQATDEVRADEPRPAGDERSTGHPRPRGSWRGSFRGRAHGGPRTAGRARRRPR